jgi:hypothetical protein
MSKEERMKKLALFLGLLITFSAFTEAENLTIYTGTTSTKVPDFGVTLGDYLFPYLQFQLDIFKFTGEDKALTSDDPALDRGDFLGGSLNFALKLPIHLLPRLDRLAFLEPYVLVGYGGGLESLKSAYFDVPNSEEKTGLMTKLREYRSYGAGLIVMLTDSFGIKLDYRSINISELKEMAYPSRHFNRYSFGICVGPGVKKRAAGR